MKSVIQKILLFGLICLGIVTFILKQYGGYIDFFYEKFTTPRAKSMIVGDSRSMQGIQPSVLTARFSDNKDARFFNYSFTIAQALMGPLYNKSVEKKLAPSTRNGIFIISITPEMITSDVNYDNTKGAFRESGQPPHNMYFVDIDPNFEYLIRNLSLFHIKGVFGKNSKMHKDGWMEEFNLPPDNRYFLSWKKIQMEAFLNGVEKNKISQLRIDHMHKLIELFKKHGSVYMVRMPIDKDFLALEDKHYPLFDSIIRSVSKTQKIPYFDFNTSATNSHYETYDGHHLNKYSGKSFTKALCDSIIASQNSESALD